MIEENRLNLRHIQYGNSCVMTAYSLVANYFVGEDIICPFYYYSLVYAPDYNSPQFVRHCLTKRIADDKIKMQEFAAWHICDGNGTSGRDCSSNGILHVHEKRAHFEHYRSMFSGCFYRKTLPIESELTKLLKEEDAILITGSGRHAILIYHDGSSLKVRNPIQQGAVSLGKFSDITTKRIGWEVADSIAYRSIKAEESEKVNCL